MKNDRSASLQFYAERGLSILVPEKRMLYSFSGFVFFICKRFQESGGDAKWGVFSVLQVLYGGPFF